MNTMANTGTLGWIRWMAAAGLVASATAACVVEEAEEHDHDASASDTWNEVYDREVNGKGDSLECSGVKVPDSSGFGKRIALTFDDGPNAATTPQVLDTLAHHGVHATFFINGNKVTGNTERALLARMLDEGHIVANHSQEHQDLRKLSIAAVDSQVEATQAIVVAAGETHRFFRFPFGSAGCAAAAHVRDGGYTITGWHVDTADWCFANKKGGVGYCSPATFQYVPDSFRHDMIGFTMSQVRQHNGGVVLFHDVHQNTANNLDAILTRMESDGYSFTNLDDVETFPRLNGLTPPFVGDACMADADCGFDPEATCALNSSGGFCTVGCEGYCPDASGKAATFCTSLDGGATGSCVSKAVALNENCALVPGTTPREVKRYVGQSGAPSSTATVCVP